MTSVEEGPRTEHDESKSVLGAVLAGGGSRRIGRNKAKLPFRGRTLIEHVACGLEKVLEDVIIVSGPADQYEFVGLPVVSDTIPGCGPLGGIYTSLQHAGGRTVFVIACDLPFVSAELIRFILDFPAGEALAKVPVQNEREQPLCALYGQGCLPIIERRLKEREFQVLDFLKEIQTVLVPITSELAFYSENLFFNINTPEDYEKIC